jgi:hypothetical protein
VVAAATTASAGAPPPWAVARFRGPLWLLCRGGAGKLVWARRWCAVKGEVLFLLEADPAGLPLGASPLAIPQTLVSLRASVTALPLPPALAGGEAHVVAVVPLGTAPAAAAGERAATLLRADSAAAAAALVEAVRAPWRRRREAEAALLQREQLLEGGIDDGGDGGGDGDGGGGGNGSGGSGGGGGASGGAPGRASTASPAPCWRACPPRRAPGGTPPACS